MNIDNLQKEIQELSLNEQLLLVESSLQLVKEKIISQIESFDKKHINLFFKLLQYNSEFQNLENFMLSFENSAEIKEENYLSENKEYKSELNELKSKYKNVPITWSEIKPNAKDFFGIWENSSQTIEKIREKAWKRNW